MALIKEGLGLQCFCVNELQMTLGNMHFGPLVWLTSSKLLALETLVHSNMSGQWFCNDDAADDGNELLSKYTCWQWAVS